MRAGRRVRKRVIFVNRFFYPDQSATSQILTDLAAALAQNGFQVSVITSSQPPLLNTPCLETLSSIQIHGTLRLALPSLGLLGRVLEYIIFYIGAGWLLWFRLRAGDIVVAKTDPPLVSVVAACIARARGAVLINWLQDLYPEIARQLNVPLIRGPAFRLLRGCRDFSLRCAVKNVVIGNHMAQVLRSRGICDERIAIIPNWVNDQEIVPICRAANKFLAKCNNPNNFIV